MRSKYALIIILITFNITELRAQTYTDYLDSAALASTRGDYLIATAYSSKAIQLNADLKTAYFHRAGYYTARILKVDASADYKHYQAAITDYSKVLEIDSTDYDALFFRGGAHSSMGFLEMAAADYQKSLLINQNQSEVYNSLAVIYAKMGIPNQALEYINKAISLNENYAKAYSNRGNIYDMMGNSLEACKNWKKGIELGYKGGENRYNVKCQ